MPRFWIVAIVVLGLVQISDLVTSIYLHRAMTHRGLKLHPVVGFMMRLYLWLMIGQVARQWVAVHRKHHKFADKEGDPHSPLIMGIWNVLFWNVIYYAQALAKDPKIVECFAPDFPRGPIDKVLDRDWLGYLSGLALFNVGFGLWLGFSWLTPLIVLGAYVSHLLVYFGTLSVINGICHKIGYRNFRNTDQSTNFPPAGWFVAGEGWHNNHHYDPFSPKLSVRWWEFDPAWLVIRVLMFFGLAEKVRPTINEKLAQEAAKTPS